MALVFADRVRETTSTAGTGTFSLLGAVNSCQSFSAIGNGNTTYYTVVSQVGTEWEVGLGTYNAGTITRDTILASSNGGAIVNFSAGTKDIFCDYPAGKAVLVDGSGNTYAPNIGGTTASAGTFTNVNLKGTGQNLFWYSTTFTTWGIGTGTLTLSGATTDPFGGTSVYKLVANAGFDPNTGSSAILNFAGQTFPVGGYYTESVYFKAAETNALRIRNNFTGEIFTFTIGSTPVATSGVLTPQLVLIGNGWYRASWTFVNGNTAGTGRSDVWSFRLAITGDGTSGVYISSPQLEYGTAVNTYIPNTTGTSIYGIPALSFDGVSSVALDIKGNLILQPATGAAIQAQQATSTAVGGNARGTYAVDFQTNRDTAAKVASGPNSFVGSGYANSATNGYSLVIGGAFNTASGESAIVAGGSVNQAIGKSSLILGGTGNVAAGTYNVVVGGFQNNGTSSSAVTTQSATMNGTTAVTLSGSNASIKVGQLVLGTNIDYYGTYVAAISGTSLTLSKAATGSGVATLSFYTPHGVVGGGGNNQATGSYSFIGGGGDAGTAANRNVASGDWSTVGGGAKNVASGPASVIAGGGFLGTSIFGNTASADTTFVGGGILNVASNSGAVIAGGWQNIANGILSTVSGGRYATARGISGINVFSTTAPIADNWGVSQSSLLILGRQTTDATATRLTSDTAAASTVNQVILPNNSAYYFKGSVIANVTGAANGAAWSFEGAIMRGANAASTVLIGTPAVNRVAASAGAVAWVIALTADTTNGGLAVTVTGAAATTIRWVAKVETTEVTF